MSDNFSHNCCEEHALSGLSGRRLLGVAAVLGNAQSVCVHYCSAGAGGLHALALQPPD